MARQHALRTMTVEEYELEMYGHPNILNPYREQIEAHPDIASLAANARIDAAVCIALGRRRGGPTVEEQVGQLASQLAALTRKGGIGFRAFVVGTEKCVVALPHFGMYEQDGEPQQVKLLLEEFWEAHHATGVLMRPHELSSLLPVPKRKRVLMPAAELPPNSYHDFCHKERRMSTFERCKAKTDSASPQLSADKCNTDPRQRQDRVGIEATDGSRPVALLKRSILSVFLKQFSEVPATHCPLLRVQCKLLGGDEKGGSELPPTIEQTMRWKYFDEDPRAHFCDSVRHDCRAFRCAVLVDAADTSVARPESGDDDGRCCGVFPEKLAVWLRERHQLVEVRESAEKVAATLWKWSSRNYHNALADSERCASGAK